MELQRVTEKYIDTYIEVGKESYCQHYLHLWQNSDPEPYISSSFTVHVVQNELKNPNFIHFLVQEGKSTAGIIKIVVDAGYGEYEAKEAMLLEKIYLLESFAGMGLGTACLNQISEYARSLGKSVLLLDTMKNGRPLPFYLNYGFEIIGEKELEFKGVLESQKPMYVLCYKLT